MSFATYKIYSYEQKQIKIKKKLEYFVYKLIYLSIYIHISITGAGGWPEFDDESGDDVVGVVNVGVALHDERVAALVADGLDRLPFRHHV